MQNNRYSKYAFQSIVGYYESVMHNIRLNKVSAGVYNLVSNYHIFRYFYFYMTNGNKIVNFFNR